MDASDPRFIELCRIVYKRNELCKKRTKINNQCYSLQLIVKDIRHNNKLKALEKDTRPIKARLKNNITEIKNCLDNLDDDVALEGFERLSNTLVLHYNHYKGLAIEARQKLSRMDPLKLIPKKYKKLSATELTMMQLELDRKMLDIKLETMRFTRSTRKRLAQLLRELDIHMQRDHYYNRINSLTTQDGEQVWGMEDIARIVEDQDFEDAILSS